MFREESFLELKEGCWAHMDGELHGSKMMSSMNLVFVNSLLGICRLQSDCIYWTMVIVQV